MPFEVGQPPTTIIDGQKRDNSPQMGRYGLLVKCLALEAQIWRSNPSQSIRKKWIWEGLYGLLSRPLVFQAPLGGRKINGHI